jgi:hypothetical protein
MIINLNSFLELHKKVTEVATGRDYKPTSHLMPDGILLGNNCQQRILSFVINAKPHPCAAVEFTSTNFLNNGQKSTTFSILLEAQG